MMWRTALLATLALCIISTGTCARRTAVQAWNERKSDASSHSLISFTRRRLQRSEGDAASEKSVGSVAKMNNGIGQIPGERPKNGDNKQTELSIPQILARAKCKDKSSGHDYSGEILVEEEAAESLDCCTLCLGTKGCTFWVWKPKDKICSLHKGQAKRENSCEQCVAGPTEMLVLVEDTSDQGKRASVIRGSSKKPGSSIAVDIVPLPPMYPPPAQKGSKVVGKEPKQMEATMSASVASKDAKALNSTEATNKHTRRLLLHAGAGGIIKFTPNVVQVQCKRKFGVGYTGEVLAEEFAITSGRCCLMCSQYPGCQSWIHIRDTCYLKGKPTGSEECRYCTSGVADGANVTLIPAEDLPKSPEEDIQAYERRRAMFPPRTGELLPTALKPKINETRTISPADGKKQPTASTTGTEDKAPLPPEPSAPTKPPIEVEADAGPDSGADEPSSSDKTKPTAPASPTADTSASTVVSANSTAVAAPAPPTTGTVPDPKADGANETVVATETSGSSTATAASSRGSASARASASSSGGGSVADESPAPGANDGNRSVVATETSGPATVSAAAGPGSASARSSASSTGGGSAADKSSGSTDGADGPATETDAASSSTANATTDTDSASARSTSTSTGGGSAADKPPGPADDSPGEPVTVTDTSGPSSATVTTGPGAASARSSTSATGDGSSPTSASSSASVLIVGGESSQADATASSTEGGGPPMTATASSQFPPGGDGSSSPSGNRSVTANARSSSQSSSSQDPFLDGCRDDGLAAATTVAPDVCKALKVECNVPTGTAALALPVTVSEESSEGNRTVQCDSAFASACANSVFEFLDDECKRIVTVGQQFPTSQCPDLDTANQVFVRETKKLCMIMEEA